MDPPSTSDPFLFPPPLLASATTSSASSAFTAADPSSSPRFALLHPSSPPHPRSPGRAHKPTDHHHLNDSPDTLGSSGILARDMWTKLQQSGGGLSSSAVTTSTLSLDEIPSCVTDGTCPRSQTLLDLLRAREDELATAAQLGLSLLAKYEEGQTELNKLKNLHKSTCTHLADLASAAENSEDLLTERTTLAQTVVALREDLRAADARAQELMAVVDSREHEIARLSRDLSKTQHLRSRNEQLELQVEMLRNEMAQLKESEANSARGLRKVSARCVELQMMYERAKEEALALNETQEHLRMLTKPAKSVKILVTEEDRQHIAQANSESENLMMLVKEFSTINAKLKAELAESKEVLADSRNEVAHLRSMLEDRAVVIPTAERTEELKGKTIFEELESYVMSQSMQQLERSGYMHLARGTSSRARDNDMHSLADTTDSSMPTSPSTTSSDSIPSPGKDDGNTTTASSATSPSMTQSSNPTSPTSNDSDKRKSLTKGHSPRTKKHKAAALASLSSLPSHQLIYLRTLQSIATDLQRRLGGADTATLNRRLKRAFDIVELARLSNSVIANIVADVENLTLRFRQTGPTPVATPVMSYAKRPSVTVKHEGILRNVGEKDGEGVMSPASEADTVTYEPPSVVGSMSVAATKHASSSANAAAAALQHLHIQHLNTTPGSTPLTNASPAVASQEVVYPLVLTVQSLLLEIAKLRTTLNDLSVVYYQLMDNVSKDKADKAINAAVEAAKAAEGRSSSPFARFLRARSTSTGRQGKSVSRATTPEGGGESEEEEGVATPTQGRRRVEEKPAVAGDGVAKRLSFNGEEGGGEKRRELRRTGSEASLGSVKEDEERRGRERESGGKDKKEEGEKNVGGERKGVGVLEAVLSAWKATMEMQKEGRFGEFAREKRSVMM
ncbi:hypothetical protein BJ742DRAFT_833979 [Cladochytrium replicatum]|nr:hypothetical protein BJ742DRAFT_833979 [Cladochytrium replicatum]